MRLREQEIEPDRPRWPRWTLAGLGTLSLGVYLAVAACSEQFAYRSTFTERPILAVLGLLGIAFALYLAALAVAVRCRADGRLLAIIVGFAVAFRAALLPTEPIQEIDIYRYLWDGATVNAGVSPYRYSPRQVLEAPATADLQKDLARLVELRDRSPATAEILRRIHFGELPSVYPPVSQAVFAAAVQTAPANSHVFGYLVAMKLWLVLFDLATLGLVLWLLRLTGKHLGWAVAYGWCPLVVKEIANSGHLDAIAVCLATLAVGLFCVALVPRQGAKRRLEQVGGLLAGSLALALAVGAKLFPVVLAPLWFLLAWRRLGWQPAVAAGGLFLAVCVWVCSPLLPQSTTPPAVAEATAPPVPTAAVSPPQQEAGLSLKIFLRHWEMNDFLFLCVVENLKPQQDVPPRQRPWFSVLPEAWRLQAAEGFVAGVAALKQAAGENSWLAPAIAVLDVERPYAPLLLARCLMGMLFMALAGTLAWQTSRAEQPEIWLRGAFLTLAWFWLLSPTQNPWYWIWAVPLLAFARSRWWLAVSGLVLVYYLRFWLTYHYGDAAVWGTSYTGPLFFDFVVTWLEFAPWLLCLAATWLVCRRTQPQAPPALPQTAPRRMAA